MPPIVRQGELARHFNVDHNTISLWRRKGMPVYGEQTNGTGTGTHFTFDVEAVTQWRAEHADPTHKDAKVNGVPLGASGPVSSGTTEDPDCLDPSVLGEKSVAELKRLQMSEELIVTRLKRMEIEKKLRRAEEAQSKWIETVRTVSQRIQRMAPEMVDALCGIGNGVIVPVDQRGSVQHTLTSIIERHLSAFKQKGEDQ